MKNEEKSSIKKKSRSRLDQPSYKKELKSMRKRNREDVHGKDVITRGKHKGLKKGLGHYG
jgi:hypothetical protein